MTGQIPLALVLLVARTTGVRLRRRERVGVASAMGGLGLPGASLAGGTDEGGDERVQPPRPAPERI